ncbi:MAG: hypothetical protein CMP63_05880 [Flavobacteriales bacterium]|nr:hypothetical protein [Flavobacteriales bacterium]|tara:strand:+ start:137 stop:658 length:522 start_codon:yes stop_codon:yes gene_type:complete
MKSLILIVFCALALVSCNSKQNIGSRQQIKWLSLSEVQEKMKSKPKKVFIDIYTDWCRPCKMMSKRTFTDPEVIEVINKEFYAVKFNAESKEDVNFIKKRYSNKSKTHDFAIQIGSSPSGLAFPTIVYFNESFKRIQAVPGYYESKEFIVVLKYFGEDHYKKMSYENYYKSYY